MHFLTNKGMTSLETQDSVGREDNLNGISISEFSLRYKEIDILNYLDITKKFKIR
jgi:hypothetical protein